MTRMKSLARDTRGATIVEFAILAPLFLTMVIGVFQTASYLQNHNSMRSMATDGAREIAVEYQKGNLLSTNQMEALIRANAVGNTYGLDPDRLSVVVAEEASSRVTDATELKMTMNYKLENNTPLPLPAVTITYDRPVFVFGTPSPNPTATATASP